MAAQSFPRPSSSSASQPIWNYDVFLSFRGKDTRKNFTDHLYAALVQAGIHTFRDDDELPRGKEISSDLVKAIEESRISIVVFSKGYACSSWCLDELVKIVECKNSKGQTVLPIFYDVDPSHVRHQISTLANAFGWHEKRFNVERMQKWRATLTEAANLSGYDLQNVANGHQAKFIQKVVEDVLIKVNYTYLNVAVHPIGIDSRVEEMKALLDVGVNDVRIVGIYGMGGIGKTTIAKAVYNQLHYGFDGCSCLLNIKEISEQPNGLVHLQEKLLSSILKKEISNIDNIDRGINLIKQRLECKRVLIVLDDVDHLKQLNSLAGSCNWFGLGSRVIITTRDESLLTEVGVYGKYEVDKLNHDESFQLFSWHAFKNTHPIEDYMELSNVVVNYVGGLPLALKVLGSYLLERSIKEWNSALEKLQKIPHQQIQKILRISFDSLDDDTVKDIFLDIACFFIGMTKEYVVKILDGCGFFPDIDISILIQRSLVTINHYNELRMHDLLRDMGREIVRERSPNDPGKCSRLWFHEDVLNVLKKQMGSKEVEGLILNLSNFENKNLKTEAFAKMKNLRLLQINDVNLSGCFEHLSQELRWLCWHKCPLKFLPSNFHLENLVVLDMQYSNVKQVWKEIKILNKLKVLNLSYSECLMATPNFSGAPCLERLIFKGCTSLVEVQHSIGNLKELVFLNLEECKNLRNLPSSICKLESLETLNLSDCLRLDMLPEQFGNMRALRELRADRTAIKQLPSTIGHLKKLVFLNLEECKNLRNLPSSICNLESLETLDLYGCSKLDMLPEQFGNMRALRELLADRTAIEQLPSTFGLLKNLKTLSLSGYKGQASKSWLSILPSWISPRSPKPINLLSASFSGLCSLTKLVLSQCNLFEDMIPTELGSLSSLEELDLAGNNFRNLPHCINRLPKLSVLCLANCSSLQFISELPESLICLQASECTSLEILSNISNLKSSRFIIFLDNCYKLVKIGGLHSINSTSSILMEGCNNLAYNFRKSLLQGLSNNSGLNAFFFPGSEIPDWFIHQRIGSSISFHVRSLSKGEIVRELLIWVVYAPMKGYKTNVTPRAKIENKSKGQQGFLSAPNPISIGREVHCEDQSCLSRIPLRRYKFVVESGDEIEVLIFGEDDIKVKKFGVHLVVDPPNVMDDHGSLIQNTSPSSYVNSDIAAEGKKETLGAKRVCDWSSNEEKFPKRLRMEPDAQGYDSSEERQAAVCDWSPYLYVEAEDSE